MGGAGAAWGIYWANKGLKALGAESKPKAAAGLKAMGPPGRAAGGIIGKLI